MDRNSLVGTWKLKSHVVTTPDGKRVTPYGEHPIGYLSYSADGRMQVMGAARDRPIPSGRAPTDDERLKLYDSMFAYAGTYSVDAGKVIHHVDVSWNQSWTGTEQIRFCELSGNTLTLSTRIKNPDTGVEAHYSLVWERYR